MNQNERVLRHLKQGKSITPLEAIGLYGVYRLAARVKELRDLGHNIITTRKQDGTGRPYASYRLEAVNA